MTLRLDYFVPSCLGPNLKEQVIPQFVGGIGKLILGLLLTGYFFTLFATRGFGGIIDPDVLVSIVALLIISPIWFGFYTLLNRLNSFRVHWSLNLIASSIASAAVAVWLLPGFLFAVFIIIFGFLSNLAS